MCKQIKLHVKILEEDRPFPRLIHFTGMHNPATIEMERRADDYGVSLSEILCFLTSGPVLEVTTGARNRVGTK